MMFELSKESLQHMDKMEVASKEVRIVCNMHETFAFKMMELRR
jgi:hypothetical protein